MVTNTSNIQSLTRFGRCIFLRGHDWRKAAVKRAAAGEPFRFDITGMPLPCSGVLSPNNPDSGGHQNTIRCQVP